MRRGRTAEVRAAGHGADGIAAFIRQAPVPTILAPSANRAMLGTLCWGENPFSHRPRAPGNPPGT
jgi:hypothetical protein